MHITLKSTVWFVCMWTYVLLDLVSSCMIPRLVYFAIVYHTLVVSVVESLLRQQVQHLIIE